MKQCTKCHEWKEIDQFYTRSHSKDGHRNECSKCQGKRQYEWAKKNCPEKLRERSNNYHARILEWKRAISELKRANLPPKPAPMTRKEITHRYYEKNKDKAKAANLKWLFNHRDYVKERARNSYAKNPQRDIARIHRRRAHIETNGGNFTPEEWNALCAKYGYRCLHCREQNKLTVDHVLPLYLGGTNTIDNIQPLCGKCNSSKGTKHIDYRK